MRGLDAAQEGAPARWSFQGEEEGSKIVPGCHKVVLLTVHVVDVPDQAASDELYATALLQRALQPDRA